MSVLISILASVVLSGVTPKADNTARFTSFNIWECSTKKINQTDEKGRGTNPQLLKAAEIIQCIRPDVLLINEIDFDAKSRSNAEDFQEHYLKIHQDKQKPIEYSYIYFAPVNTGLQSGFDLDKNGKLKDPADAFGYGRYPGQYGMALYSKYPIDKKNIRTFQRLLWKQMPGNLMPDGTNNKPAWYDKKEVDIFRLSSKSHWDIPIKIGDKTIHVLASHPTPPVFDGDEDRNGRRTFDEIRLWADYISGGKKADWISDDLGKRGGLAKDRAFVIMGDLNADPNKDPHPYGPTAADQLLKHLRVQDPRPARPGMDQKDQEAVKTCHFGRIDYVLPCKDLVVKSCGIFWPSDKDPLHSLISKPEPSSDHRAVWMDIQIP